MARLPARVAVAVITFVAERLADNPLRLSKELHADLAGVRSARVGDYRILFRVDPPSATVWVLRVNHRAHVYRPP